MEKKISHLGIKGMERLLPIGNPGEGRGERKGKLEG